MVGSSLTLECLRIAQERPLFLSEVSKARFIFLLHGWAESQNVRQLTVKDIQEVRQHNYMLQTFYSEIVNIKLLRGNATGHCLHIVSQSEWQCH